MTSRKIGFPTFPAMHDAEQGTRDFGHQVSSGRFLAVVFGFSSSLFSDPSGAVCPAQDTFRRLFQFIGDMGGIGNGDGQGHESGSWNGWTPKVWDGTEYITSHDLTRVMYNIYNNERQYRSSFFFCI